MNTLDIIFAVVMGYAFYKGYSKGIVRAVLSVLAWLFGWIIASKMSSVVVETFNIGSEDSRIAPIIAFILVFAAIGVGVVYLSKAINRILKTVMLGWANRLAGGLVYFFGAALICSSFLWLLNSLGFMKDAKDESVISSIIEPLAPAFADNTEVIFPVIKNSYNSISSKIENTLPSDSNLNDQ